TGLSSVAQRQSATAARRKTGGSTSPPRWSNPNTWGGKVPGAGDVAYVTKAVLLDVDATVAGVQIQPGGTLTFDPASNRTLKSTGNVVVSGQLVMRPSSARIVHRLIFINVDESKFVGGGMDVLPTDVGLWVMDPGVVQAVGASK